MPFANPDEKKSYWRDYYLKHKFDKLQASKEHYKQYRERINKRQNKYNNNMKEIIYDHYGRKCKCCGETEPLFLSMDHINNDGAKHRKEIGNTTTNLHRWLIKNDFPDNFQVLCMNCNTGKDRNKGVCPHMG